MKKIRGYKAMNSDMTCLGFKYEVGKVYSTDREIILCDTGFHFCIDIIDCYNYYSYPNSIICEVETLTTSKVIKGDDKVVTNKIRILKKLSKKQVDELVNKGKDNTGDRNSGDRNSGDSNSGDSNSGDSNSGYRNSGDSNSGYSNSGDSNSGNSNSGIFNKTNYCSGIFNSKEQKVPLFNGTAYVLMSEFIRTDVYNILTFRYFPLTEWIWELDMSDEEKKNNPEFYVMEGYLKVNTYEYACQEWWKALEGYEKEKVLNIKGFNKKIFKEITGIKI